MLKFRILSLASVFFALLVSAQDKTQPSEAQLAGITARGRLLAEYDVAAWHATDAVQAAKPEQGTVERYIARKTDAGWVVAFGRLNEARDQFLVKYEAIQGKSPDDFSVKTYDSAQAASTFYLAAARGLDLALKDFQAENHRYNTYVLPAESDQLYVYILPAQTKRDVYPLGGDVRYLVSTDGSKIVEKRQMHKSIIEFRGNAPQGAKVASGFHDHVLSEIPEDSDVFYVLNRRPRMSEYIGAGKHVYEVKTDGTIRVEK